MIKNRIHMHITEQIETEIRLHMSGLNSIFYLLLQLTGLNIVITFILFRKFKSILESDIEIVLERFHLFQRLIYRVEQARAFAVFHLMNTEEAYQEVKLERDELKNRLERALSTLLDLKKEITLLQEARKDEVLHLKRTEEALEKIKSEKVKLKERVEDLVNAMAGVQRQQRAVHKENVSLKTKLGDIENKWTSMCIKMSSTLYSDGTDFDDEKEYVTMKENFKQIELDKRTLQPELCRTLNRLIEYGDDCQEKNKWYNTKNTKMEMNTIAANCMNFVKKRPEVYQTHDEDANDSTLSYTGEENIQPFDKSSTRESNYQQFTSEKSIFQITGNNIYVIEKSAVRIDSDVEVSSTTKDSASNLHEDMDM